MVVSGLVETGRRSVMPLKWECNTDQSSSDQWSCSNLMVFCSVRRIQSSEVLASWRLHTWVKHWLQEMSLWDEDLSDLGDFTGKYLLNSSSSGSICTGAPVISQTSDFRKQTNFHKSCLCAALLPPASIILRSSSPPPLISRRSLCWCWSDVSCMSFLHFSVFIILFLMQWLLFFCGCVL